MSDAVGSSTSAIPALSPQLIEERDRRIAEERTIAVLSLQRKQRLEALIRKRKANFAYIQKVHEGGVFWLNVSLFSTHDLEQYLSQIPPSRTESFYILSLSISRLLMKTLTPSSTVAALSQLMEEWDYYFAGTAMQSVKYMLARSSPCAYPHMAPRPDAITELTRPSVYKFGSAIVYEYLQLPHLYGELDYVEVLTGLCGVLSKLYERFFHTDATTNSALYDTIVRLDAKIKHHVVNLVAKELTELSARSVRMETTRLRRWTEPRPSTSPQSVSPPNK